MPSKPFLPDTAAIARRLGKKRNSGSGPPDNTARASRGDHIGLSERAQGSLLDQNTKGRTYSPGGPSRSQSSPTSRVVKGHLITEDDPEWDPKTMGNARGSKYNTNTQTSRSGSLGSAPDRTVGYTGPFQIPTSRSQGSVAASSEYGRRAGGSARSVKDKISKAAINRRLNAR